MDGVIADCSILIIFPSILLLNTSTCLETKLILELIEKRPVFPM